MSQRQQQISRLQQLLKQKPNDSNRAAWEEELKNLRIKSQKFRANRKAALKKPNLKSLNYSDAANSGILSVQMKQQMDKVRAMSMETKEIRKNFMELALYPESGCIENAALPDELLLPTNSYRSVREFNLIGNMDGTKDAGRFSFAVQPILGSPTQPNQYQVGIVDVTNGWPTNVYGEDSYVEENLGEDPRVDPNLGLLTSGPCGQYYNPLTSTNYLFTQTGVAYDSSGFAGVAVPVLDDIDVSIDAYTGSVPVTPFLPSGSITNPYTYTFPSGVYNIKAVLINQGLLSTTTGALVFVIASLDKNNAVDGVCRFVAGAGDLISGYFSGKIRRIVDWNGNVYSNQQSLISDDSFNIYMDGNHRLVFGLAYSVAGVTSTSFLSGLLITATCDTELLSVSNSGVIVKLRPVALSCLVTCTLPAINAGGNIVAYSCPSGDVKNYFYNYSSTVGKLQDWEVLARNNKGNLTHDGNLASGSYTWTQPWDKNDTLMRTPTESLDYPYQGIIVSGQMNPSVAISGLINIGRIRIVIVYEYITDSRIFNPTIHPGTTNDLDFVLAYLAELDHSMENKTHLDRLSNFIKMGSKFLADTIPSMIKGVNAIGSVAGLLI